MSLSHWLVDWPGGSALLFRLALDLLTVGVLIGLIYHRLYRKTELFLTFFAFNVVIFVITYLLHAVELSMGAAFGLFAVFSMLRYRTEGISAKDMTYLFLVIALGMVSALSPGSGGALLGLNALLLGAVYALESSWLFRRESSQTVSYDRIDLVQPERRPQLLRDLSERTGLPVHRVEIQHLDFLKDAAQLTVFYYPSTASDHAQPNPASRQRQTTLE